MTFDRSGIRYVHQGVGLFVLAAIVLFSLAVLTSGQIQRWFNPGARLKVILPSDGLFGLAEGGSVQILGTKAGDVRKIVIDPTQQIYAEVQIADEMKTFVRRDSKAIIRKQFGVAGAAFIVITRGFGDPLDWDYAVLEARPDRAPTESVGELINDLRQKVLPVIDDTHIAVKALTAVASRLQDPQGPMQQLLVNLSSITGEIMQGKGVVGRLVAEEKLADDLQDMLSKMSAIVAQMMPFMDELSTTVQNVAGISDKINAQAKNLPEMSQNVNEVLVSVNQVLVDLRQTTPELPRIVKNVQQATMSMPVLLLQTHQVMLELERLLKQLQTHWLLGSRKAVQEPRSHRISPSEVDP